MAKVRGNPKTLVPLTTQKACEIGRMGGIKSGQVRRLKKLLNDQSFVRRFEIEFFDDLDILLQGISETVKIKKQFRISNYKLDGYIPLLKIAIEYDDIYHRYKQQEDRQREAEINKIDQLYWIRVTKGKEIEGFRDIIKAVLERIDNNGKQKP